MVSVDDTGCGISADKLDSVFAPFVQIRRQLASQPGVHVQPGVGLGLAISRELARAMGGEISAESSVGVGSVFTLVLPLACGDQANTAQNVRLSADASRASWREASLDDKSSGVQDAAASPAPETATD